jgi:hypothetical protein
VPGSRLDLTLKNPKAAGPPPLFVDLGRPHLPSSGCLTRSHEKKEGEREIEDGRRKRMLTKWDPHVTERGAQIQ